VNKNTYALLRKFTSVVFLGLAFWMFLTTVPRIGTYSLSDLPAEYKKENVPVWAKGFSTDHGKLVFHRNGPISEEKNEFAIRMLIGCAFLIAFYVLQIFPKSKKNGEEDL